MSPLLARDRDRHQFQVHRCPSGFSCSSKRDYHGFDSLLGIGVGCGHVLATATGLKSLPPELHEALLNTGGVTYSMRWTRSNPWQS